MPEYPLISQGLGVLTPDMWKRLMVNLRNGEEGWHDLAGKVRDRGRGLQPIGTSTPSNLIRVKNDGSEAINRYEACYVDAAGKNVFGESISGLSAQNYGTIYEAAFGTPAVFHVKGFADAAKYPKYGDMRDWFVAAESIAAGESGWAYMSGVHFALVWDFYDLSTLGSGTFASKSWLYADLPEKNAWTSGGGYSPTTNGHIQGCTLDSDGNVEQSWEYPINTPLMLRPNGRARVLWVDTTQTFSAGDCQWSATWNIGDTSPVNDAGMARVRLALIERCGWSEAVLPCNIPSGTLASGKEFQYDYDWTGLNGSGLSSSVFNYNDSGETTYVTATNLAELDNCGDSSSLENCTGCYETPDQCDRVAGYPIPKLNQCLGTCNWTMQPIGGWYYYENEQKQLCTSDPTGQSVSMTFGLDANGGLYPHFHMQNAIVTKC